MWHAWELEGKDQLEDVGVDGRIIFYESWRNRMEVRGLD
jgi:hypothetical protein